MFALVSCGNAAISAAEDFIENPTAENAAACEKAYAECDADEKKEYQEWLIQHESELNAAMRKVSGY